MAVYVLIEFKGIYPKGSEPRELMKHWHFMLGALVLVVTLVRLVLRAKFPAPAITPNPPVWMNTLAKLMHVALYAFLIAMPVLGWLTLNAHGKAVPFFGLELPHLIDENKELGKQLKEMHETLGKSRLRPDWPARAGRDLPPCFDQRRHPHAHDAVEEITAIKMQRAA